jgi:Methyltransferase domain
MSSFISRRFRLGNSNSSGALSLGGIAVLSLVGLMTLQPMRWTSLSPNYKSAGGGGGGVMGGGGGSPTNEAFVNPLAVPMGRAVNLPSLRNADSNIDAVRKVYGGKGDGKHLGGFTELDLQGVSPATWTFMIQKLGVHSVLDVGCGKGVSTSWFYLHGCRVQCVEGSHDAVTKSIIGTLDPSLVVEHDFSRGPWWPEETFDAVWAVEFLEHVGVNYQYNYVTAFRKAALLFVTSSRWGGWHHVEVHSDDWWIRKYEAYGFRYDADLTEQVRNIAKLEAKSKNANQTAPNGEFYNAQHVWLTMKVFINPVVAALPQHAHLFPEHGCYGGPNFAHRVCGQGKGGELETVLPPEYWPIHLPNEEGNNAWAELIREHLDTPSVSA